MTVTRLSWRDLAPDLVDELTRWSLYTSPAFVRLFETLKGQGVYFVVEENGRPVAALPAVEFGAGAFRRMQALPDGLFAPIWMAESGRDQTPQVQAALFEFIANQKYLRAYVTDFSAALEARDWQALEVETTVIDLCGSDGETTWQPPDKTLRAEIIKAERDGVRVIPFDHADHLPDFLKLMSRTEQRHGRSPKYPAAFWQALAELATTDTRIRWYGVVSSNELAAAHIYLVDGDRAFNWQIYYDKRFSPLKPNQAITSYAANQFRREGIRRLNLGATPLRAAGVKSYKQKWGGTTYRYRVWRHFSLLGRLI
jgi:CelD/BcsL family acetyltransferase involved in cellulose biosynthesis